MGIIFMTIIYCPWGEWSKDDVVTSFREMDHRVIEYDKIPASYIEDSEYENGLTDLIMSTIDSDIIVFTMNYLPLVARVTYQASRVTKEREVAIITGQTHKVRYVSWVYDCPHLTLYSKTISYDSNYIFVFDRVMGEEIASLGAPNVYHMPLAVNTVRLGQLLGSGATISIESAVGDIENRKSTDRYTSDITFLGTLYEDENNRFDQIAGLPDYIKGFVEGLVNSQLLLYGIDLVDAAFTDELCDQVLEHALFDFGPDFFDIKRNVVRDWIRKKVTVKERRGLIQNVLNNGLPVTLYAPEKPTNLAVDYKGYADYYKEMPLIFNKSKINLNISLRSIKSGIPLRVIDILGAGGFCLTNYQPEIAELFENGRELVWFESPEDMIDKIKYYLSHDSEREAIAAAGYARAMSDFSYKYKLGEILKAIDP